MTMPRHILLAAIGYGCFSGLVMWVATTLTLGTFPDISFCTGLDAAKVRTQLGVTHRKVFDGERLSDEDLQVFTDADEILGCLSSKK